MCTHTHTLSKPVGEYAQRIGALCQSGKFTVSHVIDNRDKQRGGEPEKVKEALPSLSASRMDLSFVTTALSFYFYNAPEIIRSFRRHMTYFGS